MSEWHFSFPQTRSCLWDDSPVGDVTELFVTRNSWIRVQLSVPALQLAVRHARQSTRKPFDCFLMATVWITEGEGIILEVDRFDPGRLLKGNDSIVPTALIPGDIAIPCQVVVGCHPLVKHLTHNLVTLSQAFEQLEQRLSQHPCPLDPALLLSLRLHCSSTKDGGLTIQCGCVSPSFVCDATPIKPVPIVKTALARNLSGPLPLSTLQGRVKHGYVTMDSTRKVILLLHSDPKATQLPLVGVWVSGVGSVYHPQVWTACVSYISSSSLSDRVWGEIGSFLLLVYVEGTTQPSFWQCATKTGRDGLMGPKNIPFEISCGDTSLQPSSDAGSVCVEIFPAQESTTLKTLLEAVLKSSAPETRGSVVVNLNEISCDLPTPSPKPTPTLVPQRPPRDSELSMLSSLSVLDNSSLKGSQHGSIASSHSSTDSSSTTSSTSTLATPRLSSSQPQHRDTLTPHVPSSFGATPHPSSNERIYVDKENVSPPQTNKKTAATSSPVMSYPQYTVASTIVGSGHQTRDGSLVVFPEKHVTRSRSPLSPSSSSTGAPSPSTQELLRQQERQLRVLQEQVNSLLRSQSATNSPSLQRAPDTPPMAEAGTNTGQSLFWQPPSTLSPPTDSTSTTAAGGGGGGSEYNESSVCSSGMADLSMQTATSILSQGVSEMHLDLQSYANSPSSSHSQSFGDSASTAGYGLEGNSHESSPASLLFKDQRQFYQNMLAQVNDLIQSQQQSLASDSDTDPQNYSNGTTPKCSPSPSLLHHSQSQTSGQERTTTNPAGDVTKDSDHSHQSLDRDGDSHTTDRYSSEINHSKDNHSHHSEPREHFQPMPAVLNHPYTPFPLGDVGDQSLPPLHPDVLQQRFTGGDISMLPVPRIMYVGGGDDGPYRAGGMTFMSQLGGADLTLDENTQMADMIALKYLGKKSGLTGSNEVPDGVPMSGLSIITGSGNSDKTLAHMSMATRQYLEKHNLMRGCHGQAAKGKSVQSEEDDTSKPTDSERILDVQRLKTLPKLI